MSTNYYLRINKCKHCGRFDELHIGKSGGRWKFLFHIDDDHKNAADWINSILLPNNKLYDEYDSDVEKDWFIELIKSKRNDNSQYGIGDFTTDGEYDYTPGEFF